MEFKYWHLALWNHTTSTRLQLLLTFNFAIVFIMTDLKFDFAERIDRLVFQIDKLDQLAEAVKSKYNSSDVLADLESEGYCVVSLLSQQQCDTLLKIAKKSYIYESKGVDCKIDDHDDFDLKPFIVEHTRENFPHKGNETFENPWVREFIL